VVLIKPNTLRYGEAPRRDGEEYCKGDKPRSESSGRSGLCGGHGTSSRPERSEH
jgi:hypothetical protein